MRPIIRSCLTDRKFAIVDVTVCFLLLVLVIDDVRAFAVAFVPGQVRVPPTTGQQRRD